MEAMGELQQAARQLLGLLALTSGAAAARRLADLLEAAPPGRCAQIADLTLEKLHDTDHTRSYSR